MNSKLYVPIHAYILIESRTDPDSVGGYFQDYTPELAQWIENGFPGVGNCKVTVKSEINWENDSEYSDCRLPGNG